MLNQCLINFNFDDNKPKFVTNVSYLVRKVVGALGSYYNHF